MHRRFVLYCAAMLMFLGVAAQSMYATQNDSIPDDFIRATLVIVDPASNISSTLGHAAIHLSCPSYNLDYVFSYEHQDIKHRPFAYLCGNLKMAMVAMPLDSLLDFYRREHRGVSEYELQLTTTQKQDLWRALDKRVMQGERSYDYIRRGCAIACVEVLHEALNGTPIVYHNLDEFDNLSAREVCLIHLKPFPWQQFCLQTIIGTDLEKITTNEQKLMIPIDLANAWQNASIDDKQLLSTQSNTLLESSQTIKPTSLTPTVVSIIILILALLSIGIKSQLPITSKLIDYTILCIAVVVGLLPTFLCLFSKLPCTSFNWLIIPFNALPLLFWYWRRYWALPYAIMLFLWTAIMLFAPHTLVHTAHIILALSFATILIKQLIFNKK